MSLIPWPDFIVTLVAAQLIVHKEQEGRMQVRGKQSLRGLISDLQTALKYRNTLCQNADFAYAFLLSF